MKRATEQAMSPGPARSLRSVPAILMLTLLPALLFAAVGDYSSHYTDDTGVTVIAGEDTLVFRFYASDIARVDFLPDGAEREDSSYVLIRDPVPVAFEVIDGLDSLRIATSDLEVVIAKYPVRVCFRNPGGMELLSEPAAEGFSAEGSLRRATFELPPEIHLYGMGERGIGIDLRGYRFSTYNTQTYGYSGPLETMKINIPLLVTSSAYAVYFESPIPATVDLGEEDPSVFYYEIDGGELSYFLIAGSDVPGQLERYTYLTGRQPLPPEWALGYIQSKYGYRNRSEAESMVHTMRAKGIPADAIVLDLYWFWNMGDLEWNTSAFPNPASMIDGLLEEGFKTIVISEPYFTQYCDNYSFLTGAGSAYVGQSPGGGPYYLGNWWSCGCDAVLFDMSNPDGRTWLWERYEDFMDAGVAGLWTDLGEPERHPWDMEHSIGSAARVHNIYNLLWARALYEGFSSYRPNDRIVNLTRSGYAGIQRYGVFTWSGDVSRSFGGLAVQLPIMINMALSGMSYHSSDLGGFTGWASPELYSRWIEFGAFTPVMRPHGRDNQPTEPWGRGDDAEAVAKQYIELRYRLLPYIYTLARETYETGMPIVRPLFFLDPDDPALAGEDDAYMFGPCFLVAPVVEEGEITKDVYLPEGLWVDYWTDSLYEGGTTETVDAPLERLPLFVRSGSMIPMQPVMDYVGSETPDTLLVDVFPPLSSQTDTFALYEDDGLSLDYTQGEFAKIPLSQHLTDGGEDAVLEVTVGVAEGGFPEIVTGRTVLATIRQVESWPDRVYLGADSLDSYASESALLGASAGYFYDGALNHLTVKFEHDTAIASYIRIEGIRLPAGVEGPGTGPGVVLEQNYPNPFRDGTTIWFTIGEAERVRLEVFDLRGRKVTTLVDQERRPGRYPVQWSGRNAAGRPAAPGIYFIRLRTPTADEAGKVTLLR